MAVAALPATRRALHDIIEFTSARSEGTARDHRVHQRMLYFHEQATARLRTTIYFRSRLRPPLRRLWLLLGYLATLVSLVLNLLHPLFLWRFGHGRYREKSRSCGRIDDGGGRPGRPGMRQCER